MGIHNLYEESYPYATHNNFFNDNANDTLSYYGFDGMFEYDGTSGLIEKYWKHYASNFNLAQKI